MISLGWIKHRGHQNVVRPFVQPDMLRIDFISQIASIIPIGLTADPYPSTRIGYSYKPLSGHHCSPMQASDRLNRVYI